MNKLENARDKAQRDVISKLEEVHGKAQKMYEDLTKKGTNKVKEEKAIKKILKKIAKDYNIPKAAFNRALRQNRIP